MNALSTRLLQPDDWPVIEQLFGEKGACGGCWCMWWRVERGGKLWQGVKGDNNRRRFKELVEAGEVLGVLAYSEDRPVGWCSFGPRSTFPRLETVRAFRRNWSEDTWSIVCFYILAGYRNQGVAMRLLEMATTEAFSLGAREIEGYPVVQKNLSKPIPPAFAWTDVPSIFIEAGYRELPQTDGSRPVFIKQKHY